MRKRFFGNTAVFGMAATAVVFACVLTVGVLRAAATVAAQYRGLWINETTKECSEVSLNEISDGPFGTISGKPGFREFTIITSQRDANGPFVESYETPFGSCAITYDSQPSSCCSDLGLASVPRDSAVTVNPKDTAYRTGDIRGARTTVTVVVATVVVAAVVLGVVLSRRKRTPGIR